MTFTNFVAIALAVLAVAITRADACTVYGSHGKTIIGMSGRGGGNWAGLNDGSVMFKSWSNDGHHIDAPGGDGNRVFIQFQVPHTSEYVITGETVAKHQTEFNDVWIRVLDNSNNPRGLYRRCECNRGDRQDLGTGYVKAYQNTGGWSQELWTIDHNPHAITGWFESGTTYKLEVSGRSVSFAVKKMMFVSCEGSECSPRSGTVTGNLQSGSSPSQCS